MADPPVTIAPIFAHHKANWRALYNAYAAFYRRPMNDGIAEAVWFWLNDDDHVLKGLVALRDDTPIGLAHYRAMPSPLRGADIGFLDDLYVAPGARGSGVGERLIGRLREIAAERGWACVRWFTADDNYRARTLYDREAVKTSWNVYEMTV